jgi:hypothetical protein
MKYKIINLQPNANNQIMKLTSIFSILFGSMFLIAINLSDDNRVVTVKALEPTQVIKSVPSSATLPDIKSKDSSIQSHSSFDESDVKIQSEMSSHVSNYINAWQLSKVTSASQKSV